MIIQVSNGAFCWPCKPSISNDADDGMIIADADDDADDGMIMLMINI